jgi:hypothetical protein
VSTEGRKNHISDGTLGGEEHLKGGRRKNNLGIINNEYGVGEYSSVAEFMVSMKKMP